jgi:hypothetical protein
MRFPRWLEDLMGRKTTSKWDFSSAFWGPPHDPSPSPGSGYEPTPWPSRGEAPVLVLLLSLGLWALIWAVVSLSATCGLK